MTEDEKLECRAFLEKQIMITTTNMERARTPDEKQGLATKMRIYTNLLGLVKEGDT